MKTKIMGVAIAALAMAAATLGVGCSQDPTGIELPATADGGSYKLTQLTATLEGDTETRTSLQTANNNVVYWTAKDRILLINTTTYDSWYYELVSGAGSSIGQFAPLNGAATAFSDLSNLVAVYPAVAAVVDKSGSKVSFTINHDWKKDENGQTQLDNAGIRSWNNDSPLSFSNNDIKVAYHVNGDQNKANFKFKQLGTWCTFSFDFTSDETIRKESLQSIEITTVDQDVQISGTQEIDFKSDPVKPTLKAKTTALEEEDKLIKWQFNSASSMSTAFSRSVMLYPGMEGKQMKITAQTSMHTFVFYAKPTVKLEPGTTLKFPIGYGEGQNFNSGTKVNNESEAKNRDFAYTVQEKALYPFYYYGDTNCYLITSGTTATIDVTPHQASPYYEKNQNVASDAPQPKYAKVIWYETELGEPTIDNSGNISGTSFTVTLNDAGKYGNALIGIYENSDSTTPLWSYHIWHPEDDPTLAVNPSDYKAMKLYENTYSGSYTVMPMALGATKVAQSTDSDTEKIKGAGLWYQWGRKDPLGRLSSFTTTTTVPVTVLENTLSDISAVSNSSNFFVGNAGDGTTNLMRLAEELFAGKYISSITATTLEQTEVEQEIGAGQKIPVSADRYMIDKTIANPTKLIITASTPNNIWSGLLNGYLWGNQRGYEYPIQQATYKSVFDPCPTGYRTTPRDLWLNFSTTEANVSDLYYYNRKGDKDSSTLSFDFYYKGMGTTSVNEAGIAIGYIEPVEGLTDFYLGVGYRNYSNGGISSVASYMAYWSGSLSSATGNPSILSYRVSTEMYPVAAQPSGYGFNLRCVKENE